MTPTETIFCAHVFEPSAVPGSLSSSHDDHTGRELSEGLVAHQQGTGDHEDGGKHGGTKERTHKEETGDTIEDETRPYQCVVSKLPATSPEQLTAHMMRNHLDDKWTLRIENTPLGIKITMRGINN